MKFGIGGRIIINEAEQIIIRYDVGSKIVSPHTADFGGALTCMTFLVFQAGGIDKCLRLNK